MPTRAVFRCQFCDAVPDHGTQRSLQGQVTERMFGEYLDAFPGRWLVWNGGGPLGPRRYACRKHRGRPRRLPPLPLRHGRRPGLEDAPVHPALARREAPAHGRLDGDHQVRPARRSAPGAARGRPSPTRPSHPPRHRRPPRPRPRAAPSAAESALAAGRVRPAPGGATPRSRRTSPSRSSRPASSSLPEDMFPALGDEPPPPGVRSVAGRRAAGVGVCLTPTTPPVRSVAGRRAARRPRGGPDAEPPPPGSGVAGRRVGPPIRSVAGRRRAAARPLTGDPVRRRAIRRRGGDHQGPDRQGDRRVDAEDAVSGSRSRATRCRGHREDLRPALNGRYGSIVSCHDGRQGAR